MSLLNLLNLFNFSGDFSGIIPEIFMLAMIVIIMLADLFLGSKKNKALGVENSSGTGVAYILTQVTLVFTMLLWVILWTHGLNSESASTSASASISSLDPRVLLKVISFYGNFVSDPLSFLLNFSICLAGFLAFWYGRAYNHANHIAEGEFYILGLLSILGGMVLVSAASLLTLYLGLELLSLPLYAMIAMRRDSLHSIEAAMKYFVMGAIGSGFLLYGFSLIYGLTGQLQLDLIAEQIGSHHALFMDLSKDLSKDLLNPVFIVSVMFILAAIGFKFGAVPFHGWVPDVYHGSPTSVTTFLATVPKLAAMGLFFRIFSETLSNWQAEWGHVLMILGVISIFIGNILAIAQHNLKRLLGYSAIAHVGFLFLALSLGNVEANRAALFYILTYALTTAGAFGLMLLMSRRGIDSDTLEDIKGLNKNHSWMAFMMLLIFLSMAGIPPLVGFDAKLFVLKALLNSHHMSLMIYALLMSVMAAGYYLKVIKAIYFDDSSIGVKFGPDFSMKNGTGVLVSLNSLAVLGLGLFPSALYMLCCGVF
jgi:NADH-quinone oxidoreductase subunit N